MIVIDDRCCMVQLGAARRAVLHARVVRQVHAVPRGHALDGADPRRSSRTGEASQADLDLLLDVCDRILGKCLCPLGDCGRDAGRELHRPASATSSRRTSTGGCPFARRVVARWRCSRLSTSTAHGRLRACAEVDGRVGRERREPEASTLTIDGRDGRGRQKGTGLVETAAAAGIEIPVFCYEPRLGPPVGACRMCLVEVEGIPKLQAGCTLTAQDGMVVRTGATSEKAAEGQNATLEFILVNHPLDCPVCDKGGECPLQDLTFRYGPGADADDLPEAHVRQADPDLARRSRSTASAASSATAARASPRASPRTASSSRATAARSR